MTAKRIDEREGLPSHGGVEDASVVYPRILSNQRGRRRLDRAATQQRRTSKQRLHVTFGVKTLLAAFVVISLPLAWLGSKLHDERRQRDVAQKLIQAGGAVYFQHQREFDDDFSLAYNPKAQWNPVEDEFFIKIEIVNLADTSTDDDDLRCLSDLNGLRFLNLKNTPISNAGIKTLERLPNLRSVNLQGTFVDRTGVQRLSRTLPNCSIQWVGGIHDLHGSSIAK